MQPVRTDDEGVTYIRPLLGVRRDEIENYLGLLNMEWCTDSTNEDVEYSRNFMRHEVLPRLAQLNEHAVSHINLTAGQLSGIRDYLEQETDKAWVRIALQEEPEVILDIPALLEYHTVIQKEVVMRAIAAVGKSRKDILSVHVDMVLGLCGMQSGRQVNLPNRMAARREFEKLYSI